MKDKVEDLEQKLEDTKTNYMFSVLQAERLRKIIKICDDNKKQNEE